MINSAKTNMARILILMTVVLFTACEDYFVNPIKDKETGEDINLLIIDLNFFKTRMTYQLKDAKTGETILANAKISFSGKNANDIVNYSGKKNQVYQTSQGQLELVTDPNVAISESAPFEFVVKAEIAGYNTLEKTVSIQSDGIKTIDLELLKTADENESELTGGTENNIDTVFHFSLQPEGLKSATTISYKVNYTLTMSNLLKFKDVNGNLLFKNQEEASAAYKKDPANFIKVTIISYNEYTPGIETVNLNGTNRKMLFHKLETGKLSSLVVNGKKVGSFNGGVISSECVNKADFLPKILGFAQIENSAWKMLGTTVIYNSLNFFYTLATVSEEQLCEKGASITFKSNIVSSFSIAADVFDLSGTQITTLYFKGNFPETFVLENVPSKAAKLVFKNNNTAFKPISTLQVTSLCSGNYEVLVEATSGYQQYQIVLKAMCPDNLTMAIAPTYSAQVRLKNTNDLWQGVEMKGGVANVLGLPDREYEMRLLWNNEWEYSTYWTKFDANGNYIGTVEPNAKIVSKKLTDGRIQISVEKIFDQNICDDLGW
jgi:hypothetical protein